MTVKKTKESTYNYNLMSSLLILIVSVDCNVEKWCQDFCLNHTALLMADALHTEFIDTLKRIELPVSVPAFGSRSNTINIKRALLAGFFMQVRKQNFIIGFITNSVIHNINHMQKICLKHQHSSKRLLKAIKSPPGTKAARLSAL